MITREDLYSLGEHPIGEPFERGTRFLLWVTRGEFCLLFSLIAAYEFFGEINLFMPTDEKFLAVAKRVQDESGYEFAGMRIDDDLQPVATLHECVEPKNFVWLHAMTKQADFDAGKVVWPDEGLMYWEALKLIEKRPKLRMFREPVSAAAEEHAAKIKLLEDVKPTDEQREQIRNLLKTNPWEEELACLRNKVKMELS